MAQNARPPNSALPREGAFAEQDWIAYHSTTGFRVTAMDGGQEQHHNEKVAMLLARCALSDAHAFRQLYASEANLLYGAALRITRRAAMADDVLHDAMLQVWGNASRFDAARGGGRSWMLALVRYRAIDAVRRVGRETLTPDTPDLLDPQPDPYERLARTSDKRLLEHCLDAIEERPRRLVMLAFLEGLTHAEVAARVGEPLGTVKSVIRRTLLALRACMDGDE